MGETDCIEQQGTVEMISGSKVLVRIRQISACGQCHAKGFCSLAEMKDKVIETSYYSHGLAEGDSVSISMKQSLGIKAVVLGYLIPFLLLISSLLIMDSAGLSEWKAGLISVAMLIPYYFLLYFFRNRLKKSFTFELTKQN
jgi:sigma-E factor negative regulatory protein RseC